MKKFLFALKDNEDIELFYLNREEIVFRGNGFFDGFLIGSIVSPRISRSLSECLKLEANEYKSILSHAKFKKLIEILITLNEYGWNIEKGSKEYEKGLRLMEEGNKIIELLNSKENKDVENSIKLLTMKNNNLGLSRSELIEICESFGVKTINTGTIIQTYEDKREYGEESFQLYFESFNTNNDYLSRTLDSYFDYEAYADELISEKEELFETSKGQVVEFDMDWLP